MTIPTKSWKKISIIISLCLIIPFSSFLGFRSYKKAVDQKNYLQHETMISLLDEKKFLTKLQEHPPTWMKEQIAEDFQEFNEKGISKAQVDETFIQLKKNYPHPYYIRYRILNNQLYRYYPTGELISLSGNGTERAIKTLLHYKRFKDMDFILTFEDGIPLAHTPHGFFHTPSKDLQAPLLVSAKLKNTPYTVLIPDWRSISKWWASDLKTILSKMPEKPWHMKRSFAVWRGTLTKNIRLKLCEISKAHPDYLDAKINGVEDPILKDKLQTQGLLGNRVSWEEFLDCKYLPIMDGVMCASPALQWRLLSNSLTLKQESDEIQWFYRALQPYIHYLPIKNDLSDTIEKLQWAQAHDDLCKQIADNSTDFVLKNLMPEDIYLYFYLVLDRYSSLQNLSKKELEREVSKDPRWVNIHFRKELKKKAKSQHMKGYTSSFSPF